MRATIIASLCVVAVCLIAGLVFYQDSSSKAVDGAEDVSWSSFNDGLSLAKRDGKKVIIDVYTDWCGWCKKMDKEVYTDKQVINALRKTFIAVKLNAESSKMLTYDGSQMTEAEFARKAGISGYPTTMFLDQDGKPITLVPGYFSADRFLPIISYIGDNHYQTMGYREYLAKRGSH